MLFDPAMFQPLTDRAWDEVWVREQIREIVADADDAFDETGLWPADEWDAWQTPTPLKALYVGAAGVVWALDALRRRGHAEPRLDLAAAARQTLSSWREEPDLMRGTELPDPARAGLLSGQSGILAVTWRLDSDARLADELHERVLENIDNDAVEVMWGSPGTMLAARAMLDWTGEERWADAWRTSAARLLERRDEDGLWEEATLRRHLPRARPAARRRRQRARAARRRRPARGRDEDDAGARHGRRARPDGCRGGRSRQLAQLGRPGTRVGGRDPAAVVLRRPGDRRVRGVIPRRGFAARRARRRSGGRARTAPDKGANICHGTAGNGYALLKTFERTGNELWLDRARRFAVHALEQARRARTEQGHGRYSLWTGDAGVAVYASDCLDVRTRYPVLEAWD